MSKVKASKKSAQATSKKSEVKITPILSGKAALEYIKGKKTTDVIAEIEKIKSVVVAEKKTRKLRSREPMREVPKSSFPITTKSNRSIREDVKNSRRGVIGTSKKERWNVLCGNATE